MPAVYRSQPQRPAAPRPRTPPLSVRGKATRTPPVCESEVSCITAVLNQLAEGTYTKLAEAYLVGFLIT